MKLKTGISACLLVLFASSFGISAHASGDDHERAMQALQADEIEPLAKILAMLSESEAGRVVEVELEQKRGRWVYEFKLVEPDGLVREVKVDARTGEVLQSKYDD